MDWNTYYNYPVAYKKWMIERLAKELNRQNDPSPTTPNAPGLPNPIRSQTMNNRMKRFSM